MKRILGILLACSIVLTSTFTYSEEQAPKELTDWSQRSDRIEKWFFKDLPRHVGNDFKETFTTQWHLLAIVGGAGIIAGIHEADPEIQQAFQPERPLGGKFDTFVKIAADPVVLASALLLTLGSSELFHANKVALTTGTMLEALILTELTTVSLQYATQRERPDGSNSHSFPSGHTSGAFALAAVTESFFGPWYGVPSFVLASFVGASRIDSNKHVASDVLAGALLGTLFGLGTARFHKKEFPDFFLVPTTDEKSAGLSLIHPF